MIADYNNDDWLSSILKFDRNSRRLTLRVHAKQKIRITEIQGFTSDVEIFGMEMPAGFRKMQFGEGTVIPEELKRDIEHMNRLNFRWGCNIQLKAGEDKDILIPAVGTGKEKLALSIAYEYARWLGLSKIKQGQYARLSV